jgi:hypothetical protein
MGFSMRANSSSGNANLTVNYVIISQSSSGGVTHYKVNITQTATGSSGTSTITTQSALDSTGAVQWVYYAGSNYTGSQADLFFQGFAASFAVYTSLQPLFSQITGAQGITLLSSGTATFGPTTLNVKTYGAASLPLDVTFCGNSVHLTRFALQFGQATGSSIQIMTLLSTAGTTTTSSGTQSYDVVFQLTSIQRNTG